MRKVMASKWLGFATCWTRPWWKVFIRIVQVILDDGSKVIICLDCGNVCDNYRLWYRRKGANMKFKKMLLTRTVPVKLTKKGWEYETQQFEVAVMSMVAGYAMVRRPRAMPFVCDIKELSDIEPKVQT